MAGLGGPLVVSGLLVVLLLLRLPASRRALARFARRFGDWAATHWTRVEEADPEEDALWQMERRRRLCADLRRVEHLLATDTWMSATRQRGNRIAYYRLVDDLRHMPVVLPTITQTFGSWDESHLRVSIEMAAQRRLLTATADGGNPRDRMGSSTLMYPRANAGSR